MRGQELPFEPSNIVDILDALPVGIWFANSGGQITWVNTNLCAQLGVTPGDLLGRTPNTLPVIQTLSISGSEEWFQVAASVSGPNRWLQCLRGTIKGGNIEVACVIDVTQHEGTRKLCSYYPELLEPFKVDPRTGLLTRKVVLQELASQVSRSRRYHNPLSIMIIRVLAYRRINAPDALFTEDEAMRVIARFLKDRLRWVDITGCWGHNEFLLILPETRVIAARILAEKLSAELAERLSTEDGRGLGITTACGLTEWRRGDDAYMLVRRAASLLNVPSGQEMSGVRIA